MPLELAREYFLASQWKQQHRCQFQCKINETCQSNKDTFITEDTVETASQFIPKDCLQYKYEV